MVNSIALVLSALVSADLLFLPFRPEQIPADEISSLYQDSDGYIWIVSYSGLSRYDGYRTVSYTIGPDSDDTQTIQMHSVIEAGDGLYIATENGLLCLDRKTGQISTVPDPLISGMNISAMTIDGNGRLWVGGDKGIFVRNGNGVFTASVFSMMPGDRPITDVVNMVVDHSGDLWFTSWGRETPKQYSEEEIAVRRKRPALLSYECLCFIRTCSELAHLGKHGVTDHCTFFDYVFSISEFKNCLFKFSGS